MVLEVVPPLRAGLGVFEQKQLSEFQAYSPARSVQWQHPQPSQHRRSGTSRRAMHMPSPNPIPYLRLTPTLLPAARQSISRPDQQLPPPSFPIPWVLPEQNSGHQYSVCQGGGKEQLASNGHCLAGDRHRLTLTSNRELARPPLVSSLIWGGNSFRELLNGPKKT
jgi:hypothetical protein